MIEIYVMQMLQYSISKAKEGTWIYKYLTLLCENISQWTPPKKEIAFEYFYIEKDPQYVRFFLASEIDKINQWSLDHPTSDYREHINLYKSFLQSLITNREAKDIEDLIDILFSHKNNTKYRRTKWFVALSFYKDKDVMDFIRRREENPRIKNYLYFIESIDHLMIERINPFDSKNIIPLSIFHNMLVKICSFSNVDLSLSEIIHIKETLLSNFQTSVMKRSHRQVLSSDKMVSTEVDKKSICD